MQPLVFRTEKMAFHYPSCLSSNFSPASFPPKRITNLPVLPILVTRIFYSVNRCHDGRITSRQIRRSDLIAAFQLVDEEEDINKVTRYFSYEHFYVLYCRFWELDHDRDYRITREANKKIGFDSNFNEVTIFYKNNKQEKLQAKTKALISEEIVERINNHLN